MAKLKDNINTKSLNGRNTDHIVIRIFKDVKAKIDYIAANEDKSKIAATRQIIDLGIETWFEKRQSEIPVQNKKPIMGVML